MESLSEEELGIGLRALNETEKRDYAVKQGVIVTAVRDGKMKEAGVTKGLIITKVNDADIATPDDFYEQVKKANNSSERVLWIRARTQTGLPRSLTVVLSTEKDK